MNKAFFVDRDGIIVRMVYDSKKGTVDTVLKPDQLDFVPGIFELLKFTHDKGYLNILISNQPGMALGKQSKKNFTGVESEILKKIKKEGAVLDDLFYCLHHPFATVRSLKRNCLCHKPGPGLILKAARKYKIDLNKSYFLGDGVNDILAGESAGCRTILMANLYETEYLRIIEKNLRGIKPAYLVKSLPEVIGIIK